MRALSHRHGVGYSLAGLPPGRQRTLQDYQYLLGSVAAARRCCSCVPATQNHHRVHMAHLTPHCCQQALHHAQGVAQLMKHRCPV